MNTLTIRSAEAGDQQVILALLHELAEYEKLTDKFRLTPETVTRDFLSDSPCCFCELAFVDGEPAGVMTWYRIYSSFAASRGVFLEDLFLRPAYRGNGYGKALLVHLAKRAVAEGATYIDWFVLDWNRPSIAFYDRLGAEPVSGWLSYRLSGDVLDSLACL